MQNLIHLGRAMQSGSIRVFVLLAVIATGMKTASAQSLNWDGQTGVFVTPLAYILPSSETGLGRPVVAYHYLDAGQVLGGFHQVSISVGALTRVEFGYTRTSRGRSSDPPADADRRASLLRSQCRPRG